MSNNNKPEIKLTENTVENIRIMAPYLDEKSQYMVFGMMLEAVKSLGYEEKKAGQGGERHGQPNY